MKKIFILCWLTIFLVGCATTSEFGEMGVKNCIVGECIIVGKVQYRVVGAPSAHIRSYGRKEKINKILGLPFTGDWTYSPMDRFQDEIAVEQVRLIDFNFDQGIELKKSGIELTPEIKAVLDAKWKSIGSYKLAVVEYKSPVKVANKIIQKASKDKVFKTEIMSKNFRKITNVIYLMNYKQTKEISGAIDGKIKTTISGEDVKITLNLSGNRKTTLTLPGNQRIAYQYSRVCWKDGEPVTIAIDFIDRFGGGDGKNCKYYGASSIYPG